MPRFLPIVAFVGACVPSFPAWAAREQGDNAVFSMMDSALGWVNQMMRAIYFAPIAIGDGQTLPLALIVLICAATFFTVRMGVPQIRAFWHAIEVVRGKFDSPSDEGEVTSFQALSSALSATVGLGNIGGVALAVGLGGPGATFWMILAGFLGMASKFTEVTLALIYREFRPDGRAMGGGMFYLSKGFAELGRPKLGRGLAIWFATVCVLASFAGGNTFQVSQSLGAIGQVFPFFTNYPWIYGLGMAAAVGVVILGGIHRIAATAERIVPLMCAIYVIAALVILAMRIDAVPDAIARIFEEAFSPRAGLGGLLGVLVTGFQRAAFSNEAGIGSSAIAHSAAKTPYAVREGVVALLEPFIDTVMVCTITSLVIVVTGAHENPAYSDLIAQQNGAALTSAAMQEVLPLFPYVLAVAVVLFAYSTMISWSYYGERCWTNLFGPGSSMAYKILFLVFVVLGSIVSATNVLEFGDLMILIMAFPNILGVVMLSGRLKLDLDVYRTKLKAAAFPRYD